MLRLIPQLLILLIILFLILFLAACGQGDDEICTNCLDNLPTVQSITGINGAAAIDPESGVRIVFSAPVDEAIISANSFTIEDASGDTIVVDVQWSEDRTTVSLVPQEPLEQRTNYAFVAFPIGGEALVPIREEFETGEAISQDATLKSIEFEAIELPGGFNPERINYRLEVANSVETRNWVAHATDEGARIVVGRDSEVGTLAMYDTPFSVGENVFQIIVTAEDGVTQRTYNVVVFRAASTDANLSNLEVNGAAITPAFSPEVLHYGLELPNYVTDLDFAATARDEDATIAYLKETGNGYLPVWAVPLKVGSNVLPIEVVAEDGVAKKTYTLSVSRAALGSDAKLNVLGIDGIEFSPSFDPNVLSYHATIPFVGTEMYWGAVSNDENASISINGQAFSNEAIQTSALTVGSNVFNILVTAENGTTTRNYTLTVEREHDDKADLAGLSVDGFMLFPTFDPTIFEYTVTVPYNHEMVRWSATTKDPNATFPFHSNLEGGEISYNLSLSVSNVIRVRVQSADGLKIQDYKITLNHAPASTNTNLQALTLSRGDLSPVFDASTLTYQAQVPYSVHSLSVIAQAEDAGSSMTVNNVAFDSGASSVPVDLAVGDNAVDVVVTAQDGVTTSTYRVTVDRQSANDFVESAFIKSSNPDASDYFGISVALSGNTAVIGAHFEDSNATTVGGDEGNDLTLPTVFNAGAAYVFERNGDGQWTQTAYLKAFNSGRNDRFGYSVAIHGDTIAVGAPFEDTVFTSGSDPVRNNGVLALDMDIQNDGSNLQENSGSVYLYHRNESGIWEATGFITGFGHSEFFGYALDMDAETLLVGAPGGKGIDPDGVPYIARVGTGEGYANAGFVYVYKRTSLNSQWQFSSYIDADDHLVDGRYGETLSLSGNRFAVGARKSGVATAREQGTVYVVDCSSNGTCLQSQRITDSFGKYLDFFGYSVSLDGDYLAVGVPQEDNQAEGINPTTTRNDATNNDSGAVYVYQRNTNSGVWEEYSYIKPRYLETAGNFGKSVVIDGNTLVVGAINENSDATGINHQDEAVSNNQVGNGAIYVYDLSGPSRTHYIKPSTKAYATEFGLRLAAENGLIIVTDHIFDYDDVGASQNRKQNSGAAYVFEAVAP